MPSHAVPQSPTAPSSARIHALDRVRIARALRHRTRYRYVRPRIEPAEQGWIIKSPCCSRNVDPTGGVIDIAWLQVRQGTWPCTTKTPSSNSGCCTPSHPICNPCWTNCA